MCEIDINDLLGKGSCALTTGFVDVFRHAATAGVAFCQTFEDLWGVQV